MTGKVEFCLHKSYALFVTFNLIIVKNFGGGK